MQTIFGLTNLKKKFKDTVVVIGVFDGVHRGHRYLIKKALSASQNLNKKLVCVTFYPHPKGEPCLISLKHRLNLIAQLGVESCVVTRFSRSFARIPAEDFIGNILVKLFSPGLIFVGENFRFGYKASGTVCLLKQFEKYFGYKVKAVKELTLAGEKISSRALRALIASGQLKEAEKLLGRPVSVLGTVIKGHKRGRMVGYPTANINPHHEVLPKEGVYAVKVLYHRRKYKGLCNIGRRPTFSHTADSKTIEVHLFNFRKNIYGQDLEIQFAQRLRDEKKFSSLGFLAAQIQKDALKAVSFLK
jgi:riboflavin kinase/FMN adenylyltransferase